LSAEGMQDDDAPAVEVPDPFDLFPLQHNMVTTLPDGYDIGQTKPEQPINTHDKFVITIVREIARGECVSLNVALGDSSQGNFASGNLDYRIYYKPREIERDELDSLLLDDLLADWIEEASLLKDYLPQPMRSTVFEVSHSWLWDSNELGDPLKLAAAKATLLKSGLVTIPELYAARNMDWRKAFRAAADAMGVTFADYQELVRDSIFAGAADPTTGDDDDNVEPTRQQQQQNAMRKATGK